MSGALVSIGGPRSLAEMQAAHKARRERMRCLDAAADPEAWTDAEAVAVIIKARLIAYAAHLRAVSSAREMARWSYLIGAKRVAATAMPAGLRIIVEVARAHGVPVPDVLGRSRFKEHVAARQEAMWRIRRDLRMSLPQIGRVFGGYDHTTVLHGVRRHSARIGWEGEL